MTESTRREADHKERVKAQFGANAAGYVESPRHRAGRDLDRLVELAECRPTDDALDVATGGGHTALALAPHVRSMVASDLTPEMLAAAEAFIRGQSVSNVSFEIAEAERMPFAGASFDLVSCRIAPHHFSDPRAFCHEVARVLRPSGRFVMIDSVAPDDDELDAFINRVEVWRDDTHVRSYRESEWRSWIGGAGLHIDAWEPVLRRYEFDEWTRRSRMSDEERARLEAYMLSAPIRVREHFQFVTNPDGSLQSFLDDKFLVRARKS